MVKAANMEVVDIVVCIYFYLELHQGFWRLRPVDYFYPLKVRGLRILTSVVRISRSWCSNTSWFVRRVKLLFLGPLPNVFIKLY